MKDIDDLDIKTQIKEISKKIDAIIQKVNDLEPEQPVESIKDQNNQTP